MQQAPPRSTLKDTLLPYTTLFRSPSAISASETPARNAPSAPPPCRTRTTRSGSGKAARTARRGMDLGYPLAWERDPCCTATSGIAMACRLRTPFQLPGAAVTLAPERPCWWRSTMRLADYDPGEVGRASWWERGCQDV